MGAPNVFSSLYCFERQFEPCSQSSAPNNGQNQLTQQVCGLFILGTKKIFIINLSIWYGTHDKFKTYCVGTLNVLMLACNVLT